MPLPNEAKTFDNTCLAIKVYFRVAGKSGLTILKDFEVC